MTVLLQRDAIYITGSRNFYFYNNSFQLLEIVSCPNKINYHEQFPVDGGQVLSFGCDLLPKGSCTRGLAPSLEVLRGGGAFKRWGLVGNG
jgi:hypothetical protein